MKIAREVLICILLICGSAALFCAASFFSQAESSLAKAGDLGKRFDAMDKGLSATNKQLQALIKDGKESLDANYYDLQAQVETTTVILRSTSDLVDNVNKKLLPAAVSTVNDLDTVARNGAAAVQGLQGAVAELGGSAAALKADVVALKPAIDGATQALDQVNTTVGHVDELVLGAKPIEQHLEELSGRTAHGAYEVDKITIDAAEYIHNLTHPKKQGFWREWATALLGPTARVILDHVWPIRVTVTNKK